jgi:hypothetical protein
MVNPCVGDAPALLAFESPGLNAAISPHRHPMVASGYLSE